MSFETNPCCTTTIPQEIYTSRPKIPNPPTTAGGGAASRPRTERKLTKNTQPRALVSLPQLSPDPFPAMVVVDLRYTMMAPLSTNGTDGTKMGAPDIIQPNSCYRPIAGITNQPYGFDQMTTLYQKYKVIGASLRIDCRSEDSPTGLIQYYHQPPSGSVDLTGSYGYVVAARPTVSTFIPSTTTCSTFSRSYKMHELFGVTKAEFDANIEEYSALCTADPTQKPTVRIHYSHLSSGTAGACAVLITMIQRVQFFGRISQADS